MAPRTQAAGTTMSGLVGIVSFDRRPLDRRAFSRMHTVMKTRPQDADSTWITDEAALGLARFTTGPTGAESSQPLSLDGAAWIVADARLDARAELISSLRAHGHACSSEDSDASLILGAYAVWDIEVASRLLGDFAFAIWDQRAGTLTAARDHLGIKPFYYAELDGQVAFANELNSLRVHPGISRALDPAAIADFLLFEGNQNLESTSFAAIKRLPPAHVRRWRLGRASSRRYWTFPMDLESQTPAIDWVEAFRDGLNAAVADRLPADRAAILLSGGLDSSAVAGTIGALRGERGAGPGVRCFTSMYRTLVPDEEADFARQTAAAAGFATETFAMDDCAMFAGWSGLPNPAEPYDAVLDASARELEFVIAKHARVVLTGHGGDPILSPSRNHFASLVRSGRWWNAGRYLVQGYRRIGRLPPLGLHTRWLRLRQRQRWRDGYPAWLSPDFEQQTGTLDRWRWYRTVPPPGPTHPRRAHAQRGLMDPCWPNYFERLDPGRRGQPLEHRHPLLDIRLVELAMRLPPDPWCVDKRILREATRGLMPEPVRRRRKTPVVGNPHHRVAMPMVDLWHTLCLEAPAIDAFVDRDQVAHTLGQHEVAGRAGRLDSAERAPLNLAFWLRGLGSDFDL